MKNLKGKLLSRNEQKLLNGGGHINCQSYTCEAEYTDGTCETFTVCAGSLQQARVSVISGHANVWNVTCRQI
ncbi:hypothetical protein [Chryseobacterium kwangjuense]|uniref:Bacteriocin n=1 Tax=Chryseobacterium kwangjuense TaxID=267125 RepID=A0A135W4E0_9FLAO|nr:hypothetical protein [Chryseobacterium kwangjuense]KXH79709.1 hypothetical protein AU378_20335 [Chryseobacterium kwangjuense]